MINRITKYLFFALLIVLFVNLSLTTAMANQFIDSVSIKTNKVPLFKEKENNYVFTIKIYNSSDNEKIVINRVKLNIDKPALLDEVKVIASEIATIESTCVKSKTKIDGEVTLTKGENIVQVSVRPKKNVKLTEKVNISISEIRGSNNWKHNPPKAEGTFRMGMVLRSAGQDNIHTYRIPGIATTNKGALIAVYDNRYNNKYDLQEDIDVGMSRSADGGETWESMKVIMDMEEWGGKPQNENGIGDPCVLVDKTTNTIWVAGLWAHGAPGKRVFAYSKPGLKPEQSGQLVLVKSDDDGLTWSAPINITEQVKKPEWYIMFQGPGMGITTMDGALVFPSQYKGTDEIPYSNIIYSKDHGKTWNVSSGAKSNTTEAQVVELSDGSLMLNMRDNRNREEKGNNNGRAVSVTNDFGQTWNAHPSSNSALPEPRCMASIIGANLEINGKAQKVLFFSNPNDKYHRTNMTIKASLDEGKTWPEQYQLELNENSGYGYSCLTMVDEKTIGILYEGVGELFFQKVLVEEILEGSIENE